MVPTVLNICTVSKSSINADPGVVVKGTASQDFSAWGHTWNDSTRDISFRLDLLAWHFGILHETISAQ